LAGKVKKPFAYLETKEEAEEGGFKFNLSEESLVVVVKNDDRGCASQIFILQKRGRRDFSKRVRCHSAIVRL